MAIAINGTTGVSGVDGSASAPALQGSDSNTGVSFGTDTVNINTGGSTRATVDSSGRVLIGKTSTSQTHTLQVQSDNNANAICIFGRSADDIGEFSFFENDGTTRMGEIQYRTTEASFRHRSAGASLLFSTTPSGGSVTERMRIDSSGRLLIAATSNGVVENGSTNSSYENGGSRTSSRNSTSTRGHLVFYNPNGHVGGINTSGSATSFNTSSDYRLKENVVAISDGITRLKTLKPSRFNFKVDKDTTVDGFLAHEVTAVPEAISGTKDEVDSDNKPVYQGIDQSKLVPLLTAALQEAVAKIEVLETKVAALEAA